MPFSLPKDDGRFKVGDTAWIHLGNPDVENARGLHEAKIIHMFEHQGQSLYVLEVDTPMDPYHECREFGTMSDSPDEPIMFYRGFASA